MCHASHYSFTVMAAVSSSSSSSSSSREIFLNAQCRTHNMFLFAFIDVCCLNLKSNVTVRHPMIDFSE